MSSSEDDVRERLRQRLQQQDDPRERLRERLQPEQDGTTALGTFLSGLMKGTADAAMSIPSATGDLLAMGAAGVEGTARGLTPGGEGFDYRRRYQEQQEQFPANVIRAIPRPTSNEVMAGITAAGAAVPGGRSPGEAFSEDLQARESLDARRREEHPIAAAAGDLGGSVAALLLTKRPLQGTIRRAENRVMNPTVREVAETRRLADDIDAALKSSWARLPARGAFRAGETGLEAAYLEVLSEAENDPILAAGLASGGQIASSNLWGGLKQFTRGGIGQAAMNFTSAALATGGLWQMVKSATPGGRDRILESIESGFDKTTYAVMLGVLGSAMGARGRNKPVSEPIQGVIEGFTTIPRTGVLGLITEFADAPEEQQAAFESTLNHVMANPRYEGEDEQEREIVQRIRTALGSSGLVSGVIERGD